MYCEMPGILSVKDDTRAKKLLIEIVRNKWLPVDDGSRRTIHGLYYETTARRFTTVEASEIFMVHARMMQSRKENKKETVSPPNITGDEYNAKMGLLF